VKDAQQLLADVQSRLKRTWAEVLVGNDGTSWPHEFPLGQPDSKQLSATFDTFVAAVDQWRDWSTDHDIDLTWRPRRVHGTAQELPTHATVTDIDTAARLCRQDWPQRLNRARSRLEVLRAQYSHVATDSRVLRSVEVLNDLDFTLLCRAADWFASNDATGLTPRQVPIEGMHAKWLNTRQALVRELAAVDDLKLLPPHPARIHFTYLDPEYRATGGRVHDSATVGDSAALAYQPRVVVISENKDTAIHMPPVPRGISVEGVGKGGGTAAAFSWITQAEHVLYWGDMDADGFEILDGFRAAGVPARSLLMDMHTYSTWDRYGTNHDPKGQPIKATGPKRLPHLTDRERELYECLTAESWTRYRRIEQERIPLAEAHRLLLFATDGPRR
jgi:hypothetical protein